LENIAAQILQIVAGSFVPAAERVQRNVVGSAVIALLALTAYVAFAVTGWFALYEAHGPVIASAVTGAVAVVLAVIVWVVVDMLNRRARERAALIAAARQQARAEAGNPFVKAAMSEFPGMIRESPVVTVLAVAALAYALMKSKGR
jgi:hypothetical protein